MKLAQLISCRHVLLLFCATVFFSLIPHLYTYVQLGYQTPKLPVGIYATDGGYYFERMSDVKDGHPFLGNPYFFEHRNDPAPAFFLADWFGAIPLLLGLPLQTATVVNIFAWSFSFLVLAYLLLRLLALSPSFSLWGSILVYSEVYLLMLRPVSMQVVFPFYLVFLIAFILWLQDTQRFSKKLFLALAAAFTGYIYTYALQIVIVTFALTPLFFFFAARKDSLKAFFHMFAMFILGSFPLFLYTAKQIAHPLYWETMQRIGLINTHLPTAALVYVSVWILLMFCAFFFFFRYDRRVGFMKEEGSQLLFFVLLGLAMISVMSSNIITGKDLELPQHIERFVIMWFALVSVYTCHFLMSRQMQMKFTLPAFFVGTLLVAVVVFGNMRYLYMYGPTAVYDQRDNAATFQLIQGFEKLFAWMNENISESTVVWTDPRGQLNNYQVMATPHYTLSRPAGVLHFASNEEIEERYLIANYFALTEADLENDYWSYGGVGNAIHGWKTHNRKVRVCQILHLDRFGHQCGQLTDRVTWKGKEYFSKLYAQYENEIQPSILEKLEKYHVKYVITDKETDSSTFHPELLPGAELVYADGRFAIYKL